MRLKNLISVLTWVRQVATEKSTYTAKRSHALKAEGIMLDDAERMTSLPHIWTCKHTLDRRGLAIWRWSVTNPFLIVSLHPLPQFTESSPSLVQPIHPLNKATEYSWITQLLPTKATNYYLKKRKTDQESSLLALEILLGVLSLNKCYFTSNFQKNEKHHFENYNVAYTTFMLWWKCLNIFIKLQKRVYEVLSTNIPIYMQLVWIWWCQVGTFFTFRMTLGLHKKLENVKYDTLSLRHRIDHFILTLKI